MNVELDPELLAGAALAPLPPNPLKVELESALLAGAALAPLPLPLPPPPKPLNVEPEPDPLAGTALVLADEVEPLPLSPKPLKAEVLGPDEETLEAPLPPKTFNESPALSLLSPPEIVDLLAPKPLKEELASLSFDFAAVAVLLALVVSLFAPKPINVEDGLLELEDPPLLALANPFNSVDPILLNVDVSGLVGAFENDSATGGGLELPVNAMPIVLSSADFLL